MRGLGPFSIPKMPSGCSSCISCRFQPLSTTYGQIAHVLLTRSPLGLRKQASFRLVRLACIRHAASVHPEPGSNSPFAHSFTLSRLFSFLRFLYSVFIGIDVSCSVFKDRPPRGLPLSARLYYHPLLFTSSVFLENDNTTDGARGRTRTGTVSLPTDFESVASTSFTTRASTILYTKDSTNAIPHFSFYAIFSKKSG